MELDVPPVRAGEALLRVEACGLCGSDIEQYEGHMAYQTPDAFPMIPGHEPVGIIEEISPEAERAWNVSAGDRIALVPHLICGRCEHCLRGQSHLCKGLLPIPRSQYGFMPLSYGHGLWGGYSEYIHLHPASLVCKVPSEVPARLAVMYQALAAGLRWAVAVPRTGLSDTVLVLGCGQRGLASVIALRAAGVRKIIVTGLAKDAFKLEHARRLGASDIIVVDRENTVDRVMEITRGRGVDVAVDVAPQSSQPFLDAVEAVRTGGTIVVAGIKHPAAPAQLNLNRLLYKEITVQGVFTQTADFYRAAVDLLVRTLADVETLHTHDVALNDVTYALDLLSGSVPNSEAISIALHPGV
jgi:threonine dehydrogenase-like Zn-dependent dehydrogenase